MVFIVLAAFMLAQRRKMCDKVVTQKKDINMPKQSDTPLSKVVFARSYLDMMADPEMREKLSKMPDHQAQIGNIIEAFAILCDFRNIVACMATFKAEPKDAAQEFIRFSDND